MLFIIIIFIFFKSLYWLYIWQLKEYRIDRMRDFLTTDTGAKKIWKNWYTLYDIAISLCLIFSHTIIAMVAALFFMCCEIMLYAYHRSEFRPRFTKKALLIVALTYLSLILLTGPYTRTIAFILLPFVIPVVVTFFVCTLSPFSLYGKRVVMHAAKKKLDGLPKRPIIIGITGSFGKTTTKEYLATLLAEKFNVMTTPSHVNVDIGVARSILAGVTEKTEVCIIEMGAYTVGEIESTCAMVQPSIGILTAVADQHLSLFGDIKTIQKTKGELIRALPKHGLCVVHADFPLALEAGHMWSQAPVTTYSAKNHADCTAQITQTSHDAIVAHYAGKKASFDFTAPIHGPHLLSNLVAAIVVAEYLGLSEKEICAGISKIRTLQGTMQLLQARTGARLIDDHYNSNPEGFLAALDYLNTFSAHRKIVVTPGMLELGESSSRHHQEVGKKIAEVADVCIVTKSDFAYDILKGIHDSGKHIEVVVCTTPEEAVQLLQRTQKNDCILLEGRSHATIIATVAP